MSFLMFSHYFMLYFFAAAAASSHWLALPVHCFSIPPTFAKSRHPTNRTSCFMVSSVSKPSLIPSDAPLRSLYPPLSPYHNSTLKVDSIHTLSYQQYGSPEGIPALFLHGGPGAGCFPNHARFFHPTRYRIVLLDQRGAGSSTPQGEVRNNTLLHLVQDCEVLRSELGIDQWGVVLGGSWGSTLAIAYAQEHPTRIKSLVLRGVCLLRSTEVDWLFSSHGGAARQNPDKWRSFEQAVGITGSENALNDRQALHAHYDRLLSGVPLLRIEAARSWMRWEMSVTSSLYNSGLSLSGQLSLMNQSNIVLVGRCFSNSTEVSRTKRLWSFRSVDDTVLPKMSQPPSQYKKSLSRNISLLSIKDEPCQHARRTVRMIPVETVSTDGPSVEKKDVEEALRKRGTSIDANSYIPAQAILTCYYSVNYNYAMNNIRLLDRMDRIHHIPCIAIHGARDPVCPVDSALDLMQRHRKMELRIPLVGGHSMYDPVITHELVMATDRMASIV